MKYLASNAPSAPLLNGGLNGNSVMDDEGGGTLFMCSWEQVERNVDRALDLRFARMLHGEQAYAVDVWFEGDLEESED